MGLGAVSEACRVLASRSGRAGGTGPHPSCAAPQACLMCQAIQPAAPPRNPAAWAPPPPLPPGQQGSHSLIVPKQRGSNQRHDARAVGLVSGRPVLQQQPHRPGVAAPRGQQQRRLPAGGMQGARHAWRRELGGQISWLACLLASQPRAPVGRARSKRHVRPARRGPCCKPFSLAPADALRRLRPARHVLPSPGLISGVHIAGITLAQQLFQRFLHAVVSRPVQRRAAACTARGGGGRLAARPAGQPPPAACNQGTPRRLPPLLQAAAPTRGAPWLGASRQQGLGCTAVPSLQRHQQRRGAVCCRGVGVGATAQQALDAVRVAALCRAVGLRGGRRRRCNRTPNRSSSRPPACAAAAAPRCPLPRRRSRPGSSSQGPTRRQQQGRAAVACRLVGCCAGIQEQVHHSAVARRCSIRARRQPILAHGLRQGRQGRRRGEAAGGIDAAGLRPTQSRHRHTPVSAGQAHGKAYRLLGLGRAGVARVRAATVHIAPYQTSLLPHPPLTSTSAPRATSSCAAAQSPLAAAKCSGERPRRSAGAASRLGRSAGVQASSSSSRLRVRAEG